MQIIPVPCLRDNYAYLVVCPRTGRAAVVDPSEAAPVLAAVARAGVTLSAIFCTHHHHDHVGGVEELSDHFGAGELPVFGHARDRDRIPRLSHPVAAGTLVAVGALTARVLHVPAHTLGAVAYLFDAGAVFTGDTLFVAGCGRLFEGTAEMMHGALNEQFAALDDAVRVYPGHEYAESNLRFAQAVEPDNDAVRAAAEDVRARRARGEFCVPSTIGREKAINPFLRVTEPAVRAFARARGADDADPAGVLAAVRAAKDIF